MKKNFFLLLLFVGCGLINSKEEWVEMTKRENRIKNIYATIQSEQSEIDNLINKKQTWHEIYATSKILIIIGQ